MSCLSPSLPTPLNSEWRYAPHLLIRFTFQSTAAAKQRGLTALSAFLSAFAGHLRAACSHWHRSEVDKPGREPGEPGTRPSMPGCTPTLWMRSGARMGQDALGWRLLRHPCREPGTTANQRRRSCPKKVCWGKARQCLLSASEAPRRPDTQSEVRPARKNHQEEQPD